MERGCSYGEVRTRIRYSILHRKKNETYLKELVLIIIIIGVEDVSSERSGQE